MLDKKVSIIYLCWSNEPELYLAEALEGIRAQSYSNDLINTVVVYNGPKEDEISQIETAKIVVNQYPDVKVKVIDNRKNLGYVGGNNKGMEWVLENTDSDYVFIHNADGVLKEDTIMQLVEAMDSDDRIAASQPLILFHNKKNLINTDGNSLHYLGFGHCNNYLKNVGEVKFDDKAVGYLSGCAMMLRTELLHKHGLLLEDLFIYHDDLEISLRYLMAGYDLKVIPQAVFYHKYKFGRNTAKFYLAERNRFAVLLMYYRLRTIILMLPIFVAVELVLLLYSLISGWFGAKLRADIYWLKKGNWKKWLAHRRRIQKMRQVSDKELLRTASGKIEFAEVDSFIVKYIGNPIVNLYWQVIKHLI